MKRLTTALAGLAALVLAATTGIATAGPSARAAGTVTAPQCTGEKKTHTVTYDKVPEKIFAIDPQSAEFILALGLGDKLVATWGKYDDKALKTFAKQYAPQLRKVKSLTDGKTWPPPVEQIAATGADIVVTIYRINIPNYLDAKRMEKDLGIKTYSFTSYCHGKVMRTFDPLYADIANLGKIFGVEDRAAKLIAKLKRQVAQAQAIAKTHPRLSVWQYAGEKVPYPVSGQGVPNAIIWLAGGKNVFEDLPGLYAETSWEQIVKRNPSVVWVQTDAGPGFVQAADGIVKATEANPGLADVVGVKGKRYVVIPYDTAGVMSVHNGEVLLQFARGLKKLAAS